jgi:hypothetical protein
MLDSTSSKRSPDELSGDSTYQFELTLAARIGVSSLSSDSPTRVANFLKLVKDPLVDHGAFAASLSSL